MSGRDSRSGPPRMFQMLGVFAEFERGIIRERVNAGLARARAKAGVMTEALTWAGTFHGIGARLLREYSEQIGLNSAFTIHDREDAADLMNLARHDLGFSKTEN